MAEQLQHHKSQATATSATRTQHPFIKMKVHYQLYIGSTEPAGSAVAEGMIKNLPASTDINDFKKAIENENAKELRHCSASTLKVYRNLTDVASAEPLKYSRQVPVDTSEESPLIVVAPAKEPQQLAPNVFVASHLAYRAYLKAAGYSADDFNDRSFNRADAYKAFKHQQQQQQPRVPPTKKTKTEMVSITMAELVESGICHSLEECPKPVYPRKNPLPFVCGKSWLKNLRELIQSNLDKQEEEGAGDDDRVQPLCLARCSRGGKTRSLYAVVEGGSFDFKSLVVSFNDSSTVKLEEQDDPLAALTRRIAFAAYKGPKTTEKFNKIFRHLVVSEESVIQWLGHARCVLLIDELNNLENLASRTTESEAFADFLKDNFLKVAGRYFVFTTHEVFITGQLSMLMDSKSNRNFVHRALPLIPSLIAAQQALNWPDLNAREAIYCGLIPGLLLMKNRSTFPILKRRAAVQKFLDTGYSEDTVLRLLKSLITGEKEVVPESLEQLMDTSDGGKMRWIPDHMVYVLGQIAEQGFEKLSGDFRTLVQKIADLFDQFQGAKTYGGDGWEALFGLVLLVRILTKQSNQLIDLSTFLSTNIQFTTSFNQPICVTKNNQYDDFKDAAALLAAIPEKQKGAHVAIYYPSHASFKQYDMLVVMWDATGTLFKVIGYQLKEGKEIPSDQAKPGFRNFVVRGKAAQKSNTLRNWAIASDDQIESFFGTSGVQWTPKKWKELKDSD